MTAFSRRQRELLAAFTDAGVRFVVIGGRALHVHGGTRPSYDLDLLLSTTDVDLERGLNVIESHVGKIPGASPERLKLSAVRLQLRDIDILTAIGDLDFEAVWSSSIEADVGGSSAHVMGLEDLMRAKVLSRDANEAEVAKQRDERDLRTLRELLARKERRDGE